MLITDQINTNELKLLKKIFNNFKDDAIILSQTENTFFISFKGEKLYFDINYQLGEYNCYFPLKIRNKDYFKFFERKMLEHGVIVLKNSLIV